MTDANDATPAPPPPAAPAPAAAGGWGPPGTVRSPAFVIIITIITFGIYGLYWQYQVFKDLKHHTHDGIGGGVALIIAIFVGIVNWFLLPSEIGNMYEKAGMEKPVRGVTGFWNLIPLVGFIIWVVKVQGAMNRRWESTGA